MNITLENIKPETRGLFIKNVLERYLKEIGVPIEKVILTEKRRKFEINVKFKTFTIYCEIPLNKEFLEIPVPEIIEGITEEILIHARKKGVIKL